MESELPDILNAICREAKAGNIAAARLYLEYFTGLDSYQDAIKELGQFKATVLKIVEDESPEAATRLLNELKKLSRRNELRYSDFSREESPVADSQAQILPQEPS